MGCGEECGFARPVARHGWSGTDKGDKMFITKVQMTMDGMVNILAIWILHADIVQLSMGATVGEWVQKGRGKEAAGAGHGQGRSSMD